MTIEELNSSFLEIEKRLKGIVVNNYDGTKKEIMFGLCNPIERFLGNEALLYFKKNYNKEKIIKGYWYGKPNLENLSKRLEIFKEFKKDIINTINFKKWKYLVTKKHQQIKSIK